MFFVLKHESARNTLRKTKPLDITAIEEGQQHTKARGSRGLLKKTAKKAHALGHTIYEACAPKRSSQFTPAKYPELSEEDSPLSTTSFAPPTEQQEIPGEGLNTSTGPSSAATSMSRGSSDSTAPTELSLPAPDCGPQFFIPGFGAAEHETQHLDNLRLLLPTPAVVAKPFSNIRPVSRADSALGLQTDIGSPNGEDGTKISANESGKRKLRHWSHRVKEKMVKICRSKSKSDTNTKQGTIEPADLMEEDTGSEPSLLREDIHVDYNELSDTDNADACLTTSIQEDVELEGQERDDEDEDDEGEDQDEDEDDDDDDGRCEFKTIEAIPDAKFQDLVRLQCCAAQDTYEEPRVTDRTKGAYNFAAFVELSDGHEIKEYVVRIPGHGTEAHWIPEDAYMLEREVNMINLIRETTSAPVPEIVDYSTDCENPFGFPYIVMTKLPGKSAWSIWFDQPYDPADAAYAYRTADEPSVETEKKRLTFLRSLARIMTDIQTLSFGEIGMPVIDNWSDSQYIGPAYRWRGDGSDEAIARQPAKTTQQYIQTELRKFRPKADCAVSEKSVKAEGVWQVLNIIFSLPVFNPSGPETFTIHHNDLDLQNILVDDDGNVTGIIDWDGSFAAPRCIGAGAVPLFLRNDWFPRYTHDLRLGPHMAWNYHHYREVYAAAMLEAGNGTDSVYTMKSAIYQSAIAAITEGGDAHDLIEKLLRLIPHCSVNAEDFKLALGLGWDAAVAKLKIELAEIFQPEFPRPGVLMDLEADLASREWMLTFKDYNVHDEDGANDESEFGLDNETDDETQDETDDELMTDAP